MMTPVRKEFLKRVGFLGLGIILIILVWDNTGPSRFIGLAGFLFGMYQLLTIISMSQLVVDDFFPLKVYRELKSKPFDKIIYWLATPFFLVGLFFLVFEIPQIDNIIGGTQLFWIGAFFGILAAIAITAFLKYISPSIYYESTRRFTVHFGLFLGCFLLSPAILSFINHYFGDGKIHCTEYKIIRKSTGGKRNGSSWIFLRINGKEERFDISKRLWDGVTEGGAVTLCITKGKLGYDFVEEFKPTDQ